MEFKFVKFVNRHKFKEGTEVSRYELDDTMFYDEFFINLERLSDYCDLDKKSCSFKNDSNWSECFFCYTFKTLSFTHIFLNGTMVVQPNYDKMENLTRKLPFIDIDSTGTILKSSLFLQYNVQVRYSNDKKW